MVSESSEASRDRLASSVEAQSVAGLTEALADAAETLEDRRQAIRKRGPEETRRIASLYDDIDAILERYQDRATDWDDFQGYAEFREALNGIVAGLPAATPEDIESAVREADDELITGAVAETLSSSDFERARDILSPLRTCAERRDRWQTARDRYRDARAAVADQRRTIDERIEELERVRSLGSADLNAPVEDLQDPIERYNDAIDADFLAYRGAADSRELVGFVAEAADRPLIDYPRPPDELVEYLATAPVGEESLPTVLEYVEYSRSKLDHYVSDSDRFRTTVATNQTYLERLSSTPLRIDWPPPTAPHLRFETRELIPIAGRFAAEETVATLREIRDLATDDRYQTLRRSAIARAELDESQRERLRAGVVEEDLTELATLRDRLVDALDAHPPLGALEPP